MDTLPHSPLHVRYHLPTKIVEFDPETGDYALFLDQQLIGYAPTEKIGKQRLDKIMYDMVTKNPMAALPLISLSSQGEFQ